MSGITQQIPIQLVPQSTLQVQQSDQQEMNSITDTTNKLTLSAFQADQVLDAYALKFNKKIETFVKKIGNMFECNLVIDGFLISKVHEINEEKAKKLSQNQGLKYLLTNLEMAKQLDCLLEEMKQTQIQQQQQLIQQQQQQQQLYQQQLDLQERQIQSEILEQQQREIESKSILEQQDVTLQSFSDLEQIKHRQIKQEPNESEKASLVNIFDQIKSDISTQLATYQLPSSLEQDKKIQDQQESPRNKHQEQQASQVLQEQEQEKNEISNEYSFNKNPSLQSNQQVLVPQYKSIDVQMPNETSLQKLNLFAMRSQKKLEVKVDQTINGFIAQV